MKGFLGLFILLTGLFAQGNDAALQTLKENRDLIIEHSRLFDVQPRIVAAVIYAERVLNVNWRDTYLDKLMALNRINSSIGFCQVKLNTARWIEKNLNDTSSKYFLGDSIAAFFPESVYLDELIERLEDTSRNIIYAVAYLAMFKNRWLRAGVDIGCRPDILGTLYSLGAYKTNGEERLPHPDPVPNTFGAVVQEFYDSNFAERLFGPETK